MTAFYGHLRRSKSIARVPRELIGFALVVALGGAVASAVLPFRAYSVTVWVIYGLLALSFTFVWGHVGIFSLGQAAFFGIGAYSYGVVGINLASRTHESVTALVAATVAGAVCALLLGYFLFYGNVGDVYLAVITIATTLVLLTFFASTADAKYHIGDALIGGYNGMVGVPPLTLPGAGLGTALGPKATLFVVIAISAAVACGLGYLLRRPFGLVLAGVRENELRTQLVGFDTRRYKLAAFVIGGAVAGLAGGLYAAWGNFVNPQVFTLQQATLVAIWTLVGGKKSLPGAFIGAALVQGMSDYLGANVGGAVIPVVLGSLLVGIVLFLPEGVLPNIATLVRRIRGKQPAQQGLSSPADMDLTGVSTAFGAPQRSASRLSANDLHKRFGGVKALDGASLTFEPNAVHCLIGPNGAGKSTFFNLLVGRYRPTAGSIELDGKKVTRARPDRRARLGMGIKLQVPCIYLDLSVFHNVWIAAYAKSRSLRTANRTAEQVVLRLGLTSKAQLPARALAHGERQWLEIGMVMAHQPTVVLLDEPTAGLTRGETGRYLSLVDELSRSATVVVVEHDMTFVRELDAPVTMFHEGRVFASGTIDQLRSDERVLDIYLGRPNADARNA